MIFNEGSDSSLVSGRNIRGRAVTQQPFPFMSGGSLFSSVPLGGGNDFGDSLAVIDNTGSRYSSSFGGVYDYGTDFVTELTQNLPYYEYFADYSVNSRTDFGDILEFIINSNMQTIIDEQTLVYLLGVATLNYNAYKGLDYSQEDKVHVKVDGVSVKFNAYGQLKSETSIDQLEVLIDEERGLGVDEDVIFVKVDGDTIQYNENGQLVSLSQPSPPSSATLEFVQIIDGLSYEDDKPYYVCRLVGKAAPTAFDAYKEDYAAGYSVLYSGSVYIAKSGYQFTSSPMPNPDTDTDNWEVSSEMQPYLWHKGETLVDMREYIPWLKVDKYYPVAKFEDAYYFMNQFTYAGVPGSRSISYNEVDERVMACVSDTIGGV